MRYPQSGWSALRLGLLALGILAVAPVRASGAPSEDAYAAGYAAAVLERQFNVSAPSMTVKDGVLTLDGADLPHADRERILGALRTIPGVKSVEVRDAAPASPAGAVSVSSAVGVPPAAPPAAVFLPAGYLFRPLIADPRWPRFSAAYRYYTSGPDLRNVAAVSFGETLPLYRDGVGAEGRWGQWETGLQAAAFSIFNLDSDSFDLVNTDFFVAGYLSYRRGPFSALARIYHQSSHLGDELLLSETRPNRINLSYEGIDAKLSFDLPGGSVSTAAAGICSTWIPPTSGADRCRRAPSSGAPGRCGKAASGPSGGLTSSSGRRTSGTPISRCGSGWSSRTCACSAGTCSSCSSTSTGIPSTDSSTSSAWSSSASEPSSTSERGRPARGSRAPAPQRQASRKGGPPQPCAEANRERVGAAEHDERSGHGREDPP
jgi:hypothetical protein